MVKNISSINSYQVSNGINQGEIQDKLVKSKQAVSDNFESNSAVKTVSGTKDPDVMRKTLFLLPPLVIANRAVDSAIGGKGEKSLLSGVAKIGDKISNVLHLDKILSEGKVSKFSSFVKNNRFLKYFTKEYAAVPKTSMAKSQTMAEKYTQELVSNLTDLKFNPQFANLFEKGSELLSPETMKVFEKLGPIKTSVTGDYLVSVLGALEELGSKSLEEADKNALTSLQNKIVDFVMKSSEGKVSSTKGVADDIASVLSRFMTNDKYKDIVLSSNAETQKVLASVSTSAKKAAAPVSDQLLNAVDDVIAQGVDTIKQGGITSDPVKLSTLKNKLKAADSKMGSTLFGKGLAKGTLKTKDVLTYGGGLISLAFTANAIIQASKAAKEAPKGEKKSTFMHVLSENYVGLILFQPCINLMYKIGGNKYRGMTTAGREALKDLVAKTNADTTLTKEGLKIAKMQRDLLIKGVDKDKVASMAGKTLDQAKTMAKSLKKEGAKLKFWEKPLKFIGKVLDTGLDKMKKPKFANLPVLGKVKIPQPTLKGFLGGLGRFAIIMFVLQPLIQKPITKLFHKIFGTPKTYLAKKEAEANAANQATEPMNKVLNTDSGETNLINIWTKDHSPVEEVKPQQSDSNNQNQNKTNGTAVLPSAPLESGNGEEIPALNIFNKDKKQDSKRYIPSIDPVQVEDNEKEIQAKVNAILKSTDSVITKTKKFL